MSSGAVLAGIASTAIFATSALPMLVKAYRSRDLSSYSLGNLVMSNVGNAVHSLYVYSLPPGPIWGMHAFYAVTSALMLAWYLRWSPGARRVCRSVAGTPPELAVRVAALVGVATDRAEQRRRSPGDGNRPVT
jgi:hypothetical protein